MNQNQTPIMGFQDQYRFLSNFFVKEIFYWENQVYSSAEHAYQVQKTHDRVWQKKIAAAPTPGQAKSLGKKAPLKPEWEFIKLHTMFEIVRRKFDNESLAQMLLATGDRELVELNHWGDTFWGVILNDGKRVGQNNLGKILMLVRAKLREEANVSEVPKAEGPV